MRTSVLAPVPGFPLTVRHDWQAGHGVEVYPGGCVYQGVYTRMGT